MSKKLSNTNPSYLVGDIRFGQDRYIDTTNNLEEDMINFIADIQDLMDQYGVVKIDIGIDPKRYIEIMELKKNKDTSVLN